jgi:hypothetical protein
VKHVHSEITPEVLDRIHRALEDEDSPAPWIQRAFDALGHAQAAAARAEALEAALRRLDAIARVSELTKVGEVELLAALDESFRLLHPTEKPA